MSEKQLYLEIRFQSGGEKHFIIETRDQGVHALSMLKQSFEQGFIVLQLPDRAEVVALGGVESIRIAPSPVAELANSLKVVESLSDAH